VSIHERPGWKDVALLVALGVGWGSTQPLGKIAASTGHPPFGLIFWQTVIMVVVLGALMVARGLRPRFNRGAMIFFGVVAVLGTIIPNASFYISVARLPAGIMSILISTVPLIAFPMAMAVGADRFGWQRLGGLMLGMVGVALIVLPRASLPDPAMVAFLPLAMVGPFFYALEGVFVARFGTGGMHPIAAMFGTMVLVLILLVPILAVTGQFYVPSLPLGTADLALILSSGMSGILYATYVGLAVRAGAVFATQTSYVVTVAGIAWASLLLGERLSAFVLVGATVLLLGVSLVRPRHR